MCIIDRGIVNELALKEKQQNGKSLAKSWKGTVNKIINYFSMY